VDPGHRGVNYVHPVGELAWEYAWHSFLLLRDPAAPVLSERAGRPGHPTRVAWADVYSGGPAACCAPAGSRQRQVAGPCLFNRMNSARVDGSPFKSAQCHSKSAGNLGRLW
jgi:hypothetical protein